MRRSISAWWPPRQRMSRHTQEPGAGLFHGLCMRLTLWYCGMLGMALVLFGVVLYFGAQYFLLTPIETEVHHMADLANNLLTLARLDSRSEERSPAAARRILGFMHILHFRRKCKMCMNPKKEYALLEGRWLLVQNLIHLVLHCFTRSF